MNANNNADKKIEWKIKNDAEGASNNPLNKGFAYKSHKQTLAPSAYLCQGTYK